MTSPRALCLLVPALLSGCGPSKRAAVIAEASSLPHGQPKELVLYRVAGIAPIELRDEFGAMLINDGDDRHPVARYVFGSRKDRKLIDTTSLQDFVKQLRTLAPGTVVHRYDSCQVPRSRGLPEAALIGFESAFRTAGLKLTQEPKIVCVCEDLG